MNFGVQIKGLGSGIPSKVIRNEDLEQFLETSSEWIETRTGILERRVCDLEKEDGLSLSFKACKKALGDFPVEKLDLIIVATSTPDYLYPSTACRLQEALKAPKAVAFDLSAACSGFVFALVNACQFLQNGNYQNALVVGVDIHSRFLDWTDRSTSILFGDGAGAVFLERTDIQNNQLAAFNLRSDGSGGCDLSLKCVGGEYPMGKTKKTLEAVFMNGKKIYSFAIKTIPELITEVAHKANISTDQIDHLICHQANQRILDAIAEKLNWQKEKCLSNIAKYGNTSAASIPLAWDEFAATLPKECILALAGFGAGLTWGGLIWKWKKP